MFQLQNFSAVLFFFAVSVEYILPSCLNRSVNSYDARLDKLVVLIYTYEGSFTADELRGGLASLTVY